MNRNHGQPVCRGDPLHRDLVHPEGASENPRPDAGQIGEPGESLDAAVLAPLPVEGGKEDVDRRLTARDRESGLGGRSGDARAVAAPLRRTSRRASPRSPPSPRSRPASAASASRPRSSSHRPSRVIQIGTISSLSGIGLLRDRGRRRDRDLVLGRTPAEKQSYADPAFRGHQVLLGRTPWSRGL